MSYLFRENWGWLLLSALLGAGITFLYMLRKVTVSTLRVRTVTVPAGLAGGIVPGRYAGSAESSADGAPPAGFDIKGDLDSMLFHPVESPYFGPTIAEVWFDSEDSARAAGFSRWDDPHR